MNTPPIGRHYDIDGRALAADRAGNGTPSLVILPGAGMIGLDFWNIHHAAAAFTTSFLYDRAGTGWSERPTAWPPGAAETARDLAALLRTAEVPAPYVLLGHSLGGAYARRFAQLYPDDVAGMVLLEPAHEDWNVHMPEHLRIQEDPGARTAERLEAALPEITEELIARFRAVFTRMYADWPDDLRELVVARHLDPALLAVNMQENATLPAVLAELRAGGPVPDVPTVYLTGMAIDPGQALTLPEPVLAEQNAAKLKLFAAAAAAAPQGEHRVLDDAGHSAIHTDRPDAVLAAIRDVLARAR